MTVPSWAPAGAPTAPSAFQQPGAYQWSARPHPARIWWAYGVLIFLFALIGPYSLHPAAAEGHASSAAAGEAVQRGAPVRRIAIVVLAGFAALTVAAARRRRGPANRLTPGRSTRAPAPLRRGVLPWLLLAYVGVAAASVAWATDPAFTARRTVVFLTIAFAAFAVAQAWSLRDLVYFSLLANATSLVIGLGAAIARGGFTPLASDWRLIGTVHPNMHAMECACLAIAAATALRLGGRRGPLIAVLVFALVMLLLTKSRTAAASLVLAAGVCGALAMRRQRLVALAAVVVAAAFAILVFAPDVASSAHNAVLMGRSGATEDPTTFSGRTLLWADLLSFASDHPLLGVGFDSFWTPDHIATISLRNGWVIDEAHSGYIEMLLNMGWLGLAVLVTTLLAGLRAAVGRYRATHMTVALFAVAMLVWYMSTLILEAQAESHISTFLIMAVLAHYALRSAAPDEDPAEATTQLPTAA